jgi:multiple sugar transport system permease protein
VARGELFSRTPSQPWRWRGLSDRQLAFVFVLPTALLLLVLQLYPFLLAAHDSLFETSLYTGEQAWAGIQNYLIVLRAPGTHDAFVRSLIFVVAGMAIQTSVGIVSALLLNSGLRGQTLARGLTFFPYMVPAIVAAMAFRISFNEVYGIVNYVLISLHVVSKPISFLTDTHTILLTVIIVTSWKFIPFMTIALLARLQTLPRDMLEAATVDGAGRIRRFWHITLPWLMPVLLVAMLLRTIWMGTEFDTPYLVAFGGPLSASTLVPIQIRTLYVQEFEVGQACALALSIAVVLAIAALFYLWAYRKVERQTLE